MHEVLARAHGATGGWRGEGVSPCPAAWRELPHVFTFDFASGTSESAVGLTRV